MLGPFEVEAGGRPVELARPRLRALLAVLVATAGRVVSVAALVDGLWGPHSPAGADRTTRVYVSLVRTALLSAGGPGHELIVTRPPGYALLLDPDAVDAARFERLAAAGRQALAAGQPAVASERLAAALGLWRGEAYAEFADNPILRAEATRLEAVRLTVLADRIEADLAGGVGAELVAELEGLTARQPGHERLWGQLMTALYRAGRQTDALTAYRRARAALVAASGVEPTPALAGIHQQILAHDRGLLTPRAAGGGFARSADRPGSTGTLPAGTGAFTGRAGEIQQITAAASGGRVLVIHAIAGMPGVGKTALAVHVAHRLAGQFPDGCVFVDLHGHTAGRSPADPGEVLAGLLAADGVDPRRLPAGTEARSALWRERLAGRRTLVVLDNAVNSAQVAPLLPASAGCVVLVTSRRFLGDLPVAAVAVSLDVLAAGEAEQMFLRLAPHAGGHLEQVADLVAACGYLPLAISLLARVLSRHRGWTVADLLTETRTRLLDVTAEHGSVAAAFGLSYQHLPAARQRFFRRLALHPGTEIEPRAAAALAGVRLAEATGQLDALHADSLLIEVGYHRYAMHDLIRSYAGSVAALDPAQDRRTATDRLLDFYQRAASTADARLNRLIRPTAAEPGAPAGRPELPDLADPDLADPDLADPDLADPDLADPDLADPDLADPDLADPDLALSWLRAERANLLACLAGANDRRRIVALTAGLSELLRRDGPWTEALALHAGAAQAAADLGDKLEHANALGDLATVRRLSGDSAGAEKDMRLALDLYQQLGDRLGEANALTGLGKALCRTADYAAAAAVVQEALDLYRDLGDRLGEAGALAELAVARGMTSDFHGSQEVLSRALALYRRLGDRPGQAYALRLLGSVHDRVGDYSAARDVLRLALDLYQQLGGRLGQALTINNLGRAATGVGDYPEATHALRTALDLHREIGHRLGQSMALFYLGCALRRAGDLPGAGAALREALALNRDIRNRSGEAMTLNELGGVYRMTGELDRAVAAHHEALELAARVPSPWDEAQSLAGFGRCALARGRSREAAAGLRAALDIFRRIGAAEATEVTAELAALA